MSNPTLKPPVDRNATIRVLGPDDLPMLSVHLLRLDPESRRERFNGAVDSDFIARYATSCGDQGVTVLAYLQSGEVHAAAEIHEPNRSQDMTPEIAFSVERHLRRQGVGSALFAAMLTEAKRAGYKRLRVTTGAQNCAMRALAQKFGTKLEFRHGELSGSIDVTKVKLPSATPALFDQDWTNILTDFNRAIWAPVLRMYGLQPLPSEQTLKAAPLPAKTTTGLANRVAQAID